MVSNAGETVPTSGGKPVNVVLTWKDGGLDGFFMSLVDYLAKSPINSNAQPVPLEQ